MSTLNDKICKAITLLHFDTKKEWIALKEIYSQVKQLSENDKNVNDASIRDAIEKHCKLSVKYNGKEHYILKEKKTGLYKSVYYDKIKIINNINIGDIFTRAQLMKIFKINGQSGIMKTNKLNCLVLITSENDVYEDGLIENGLIDYTGEGLTGDQKITKNNKTIYESRESNIPMFLFSKDKNRKYIFEGRVELHDKPYQIYEKDVQKKARLVWKFPLKVTNSNTNTYQNENKFKELVYKITEIENKSSKQNKLQFIEGALIIRKYRKTDRKVQRSKKPDFVAEEVVKSIQGEINEKKIYEQELDRLKREKANKQVKKMIEFYNNKKENEGFDVLSFELDKDGKYVEKYIEVKSTKSKENTPIDITADEIEFAKKHINNYYLYRIFNSDSLNPQYKIITGKELLSNKLYNFVPTSYKIYLY